MEKRSVEAIIEALNEAQVRYLVVGGVAVVAHGYLRLTVALDLVLALDELNLQRATAAFAALRYRPRAPVALERFADAAARDDWVRNKNLLVFSLWSSLHPNTEVDLFVQMPFDFETVYARAVRFKSGAVEVVVVSRDDLLQMKRAAGRPQDSLDLQHLEMIGDNDHD